MEVLITALVSAGVTAFMGVFGWLIHGHIKQREELADIKAHLSHCRLYEAKRK